MHYSEEKVQLQLTIQRFISTCFVYLKELLLVLTLHVDKSLQKIYRSQDNTLIGML